MTAAKSTYDTDFVEWSSTQSALMKNRQLQQLDIENIIEEIESLGKRDKRSLQSHLRILLAHMLKKKYQPEMATNSWDASINNAKIEIRVLIDDSPSLKNEFLKVFDKAYSDARQLAKDDTGLPLNTFPQICELGEKEDIYNEIFN